MRRAINRLLARLEENRITRPFLIFAVKVLEVVLFTILFIIASCIGVFLHIFYFFKHRRFAEDVAIPFSLELIKNLKETIYDDIDDGD